MVQNMKIQNLNSQLLVSNFRNLDFEDFEMSNSSSLQTFIDLSNGRSLNFFGFVFDKNSHGEID